MQNCTDETSVYMLVSQRECRIFAVLSLRTFDEIAKEISYFIPSISSCPRQGERTTGESRERSKDDKQVPQLGGAYFPQ